MGELILKYTQIYLPFNKKQLATSLNFNNSSVDRGIKVDN